MRFSLLFVMVLVGAAALIGCQRTPVTSETPPDSDDRVGQARTAQEQNLRKLCADANLPYPPPRLFLRAFKHEQILELWAGLNDAPLKLLTTFPLTASSGRLGPKRREGDRQIPEGVYEIDRFNPKSRFHLSLGLNYPNTSDRLLGDPEKPGFDIFIHGSDQSIGCLAVGDDAIEMLFVIARDHQDAGNAPIPVHIFPARFESAGWKVTEEELIASETNLAAFWDNLRTVYTSFEETRRIPNVEVDADGKYQVLP